MVAPSMQVFSHADYHKGYDHGHHQNGYRPVALCKHSSGMEGVYLFNEIYNYNTKETSQQVYSHADDQKGHRLVDWLQKFQKYISYRVN